MNSTEAIREIAEKHFPCVGTRNDREYRKMEQDALVSSITALISGHYVERELYEAEKELNTLLHEAMITAEKRGHDKAMEAISEHYVAKEKYDELLQQRDELREALKNLMDGVRGLPPLTAIVGVLEKQYKQAEAAIKNTDG